MNILATFPLKFATCFNKQKTTGKIFPERNRECKKSFKEIGQLSSYIKTELLAFKLLHNGLG